MMGFSIDGTHCSEFGIYLLERPTRVLPDLRQHEITIPGRHGIYDAGTELGTNSFTLTMGIVECDKQAIWGIVRQFASFINPLLGYRALMFDDEPGFIRYVKASEGAEVETIYNSIRSIGRFSVQFKMADPFMYNAILKQEEWDAPYDGSTSLTNNGGVDCPLIIKLYAPTNTAATMPAAGVGTTNPGTANTASVTGITITISEISVKYAGEITANDEVIIDTREFTVRKNGQNSMQYWEGDFPQLQIGENIITEHDDSGVGARVVFQFRERWL